MIGVYDSGIGGLSVLRALRAHLPGQDIIYLADSGHGPYGERTSEHVLARARRVSDYLIGRGIEALVVACNTATAVAIQALRSAHPHLPIIGLEPALKPAVALSRTRRIGVLATRGTVQSDKFARLLESLKGQGQFIVQACDGLALAIENSLLPGPGRQQEMLACAGRHIQARGPCGTRAGQIDTLVLGCTHYPLIAPELQGLVGPAVQLVETGVPVARQTLARLSERGWRPPGAGEGRLELLATGQTDGLQAAAQRWLHTQVQARSVELS